MRTNQKYTTQFINQNYLIKVYGQNESGKKLNKLVGVKGCLELIGLELMEKFITRAIESGQDKTICKLRRGLVVTFYAH